MDPNGGGDCERRKREGFLADDRTSLRGDRVDNDELLHGASSDDLSALSVFLSVSVPACVPVSMCVCVCVYVSMSTSVCHCVWSCYNQWQGYAKVGHLILVNQDTADILLPFAKMLRYAKITSFGIEMCDVAFIAFTVVWIVTRHGVYFWIISHIYWHAVPTLREEGTLGSPYGSQAAINIFLVALGILQGLLLFWLMHLLKAVYAAIFVGTSNIEISTDNYDDRKERKEK